MLKTSLAAAMAGALLVVGACAPRDNAADVRAEIEAQAAAWEAAYNAGDAGGVAALYAEDGVVIPPLMDRVSGREAIAAFWQGAMDSGLAAIDLVTEDVYAGPDTAAEVGTAVIFDAEGNSPGTSAYIVVWKKTGEGWLILRDLWNEHPAEMPDALPMDESGQ